MFNAIFINISAISWRPVLEVEEARVPGENLRPWVSNWVNCHSLRCESDASFLSWPSTFRWCNVWINICIVKIPYVVLLFLSSEAVLLLLIWLPKYAYAETDQHIQLLHYQKMKSLLFTYHSYLLLVFPWKMRIAIFPCYIGCQNYTSVHTNKVISQEQPSVLPSLCKILTSILTVVKTGPQK